MMRFYFLRTLLFCLFFSLLLSESSLRAQVVSPFQTGHYLVAFDNIRDMTLAPPGLFIIQYDYYAFANTYVDKDGTKHKSIDIGNNSVDLTLQAFAPVPAIFWAAKPKVLGATYMFGVAPNYLIAEVNILDEKNGSIDGDPQTASTKISGWNDVFVSPLTLTWGLKHFDLTFSYAFTAPTGRYEFGASDNIGLGYWSNQFQGYAYYYTSKEQTTAFMLAVTFEQNGKIKGIDAIPGNRLAVEWGWSQYVSSRIEVGIQGGTYWQLTDDRGSDIDYDVSVHDMTSTVGLLVGGWAVKDRLELIFKYNRDFAVRENFIKNGFMINALFLTNALTGSKKKKSTK